MKQETFPPAMQEAADKAYQTKLFGRRQTIKPNWSAAKKKHTNLWTEFGRLTAHELQWQHNLTSGDAPVTHVFF
jgi:hypothetical protein